MNRPGFSRATGHSFTAAVRLPKGTRTLAIFAVAVFLASCGKSEDERVDAAADIASDVASEATYEGQGRPYGCTDDCSGHEAGFEWAKEKGIGDESECSGDSQSFEEGCKAYVEAYFQAFHQALDEQ